MPFTQAVINETLRLAVIFPVGVPHKSTQEVRIGDYTIPANTVIIANTWALHFDQNVWRDPTNFRPDRFLNEDDGSFVKHEGFLAFSVGKRKCIGETMAMDQLFMFVTNIFKVFNVGSPVLSEELDIDPVLGNLLSPKPHKLVFTVRKEPL